MALEARFLPGKDCGSTRAAGCEDVYGLLNGRAYRLAPKEGNALTPFRITGIDTAIPLLIGRYQSGTDVGKEVSEVAHQPETRL